MVRSSWAAQYYTGLLNKLTPEGIVVSILSSEAVPGTACSDCMLERRSRLQVPSNEDPPCSVCMCQPSLRSDSLCELAAPAEVTAYKVFIDWFSPAFALTLARWVSGMPHPNSEGHTGYSMESRYEGMILLTHMDVSRHSEAFHQTIRCLADS